MAMASKASNFVERYGYDLIWGSIAAFYVMMVPYTKVEESFNVQAMHDILYHRHHIDNYDHLEFPGVVPRSFIGAFIVSFLSSPFVIATSLLKLPKIYGLLAVRMALGCVVLYTLRFVRVQIRQIFGHRVEAFFVLLTAIQFHLLYYCTRPLPNILALGMVNIAYGYLLKGHLYSALNCLIFATVIFRCDMLLLLGPLGMQLLLTKQISLWNALKNCIGMAILCIGLTILVDSITWKRLLWPEFEVFWFNSVLNKSSEWGIQFWPIHTMKFSNDFISTFLLLYCYTITIIFFIVLRIISAWKHLLTHPFHWYFSSALPRLLLAAYPLSMLGVLLDRRIRQYIIPVISFILLYSNLPHKELRFIISSVPVFNLSAAIAATRICNNKRKTFWKLLFLGLIGLLIISLGGTIITFMASYNNYPSGYAIKELHQIGFLASNTNEQWVHIDTFSAMNGISRFCERDLPWRYSKEEDIPLEQLHSRNFTFLINEHPVIGGFKCLFAVNGFSRIGIQRSFPLLLLVTEPKVYVHGTMERIEILNRTWPGCS